MDLDPYAELDVPRDATPEEIKKAYRRGSKSTHPNGGKGDAAAFARTNTAMMVLTDPVKREKFDRTGKIEEDKPDNDRASALVVIEQEMATIVNQYLSTNLDPSRDPRKIDIPAAIIQVLRAEISTAETGVVNGRRAAAALKDIARRFKMKTGASPENPVARSFARQIDGIEKQIDGIEDGMRVRKLAIKIMSDYEFERDLPTPIMDDGFLPRSWKPEWYADRFR